MQAVLGKSLWKTIKSNSLITNCTSIRWGIDRNIEQCKSRLQENPWYSPSQVIILCRPFPWSVMGPLSPMANYRSDNICLLRLSENKVWMFTFQIFTWICGLLSYNTGYSGATLLAETRRRHTESMSRSPANAIPRMLKHLNLWLRHWAVEVQMNGFN